MSGSAGGEGVALSEDEQRTVAAEVAAVLAEHAYRDARRSVDSTCWEHIACRCGWLCPCNDDPDENGDHGGDDTHRAHVAEAIAAHLHARHAAALDEARCPTCGPTTTENHPRKVGVLRCANCKEHLCRATPPTQEPGVVSGSAGGEGVAGHFCGQVQPHATHAWQTPPTFGGTTLISTHQCGGITPARAGAVDTLRQAVEALVRSPRADKFRDEACRHAVAQPYADNRYVRLLDDLRRVLDDTKDQQ